MIRDAAAVVGERPGTGEGLRASRRGVLSAAGAIAAGTVIGRVARASSALASPSKAQDVRILSLVLELEQTQVAFYEQALRQAGLRGELRDFAETALEHERQHLAAIRTALGSNAGRTPHFDFGARTKSPTAFRVAAIDLEDLAVAAYNGQATNLTKPTLAAAATIVSVEARHAAWVRAIADEVAAPDAVDKPVTASEAASHLRTFGLRP